MKAELTRNLFYFSYYSPWHRMQWEKTLEWHRTRWRKISVRPRELWGPGARNLSRPGKEGRALRQVRFLHLSKQHRSTTARVCRTWGLLSICSTAESAATLIARSIRVTRAHYHMCSTKKRIYQTRARPCVHHPAIVPLQATQ
eukprot:scaffold41313_cov16-Tisochrysis_lutea.AAC.1